MFMSARVATNDGEANWSVGSFRRNIRSNYKSASWNKSQHAYEVVIAVAAIITAEI